MSARRATLLACLAFGSSAMGPLEKNHPLVEEGSAAYEEGQFERALEKYDAAALERPQDAKVQYDRGLALHKLGRHEEARGAFERAKELDHHGALTGRIHYNLGNVAYAAGRREDALAEYRRALLADPKDEQARHNLEVVLKNLPPKSPPEPDGGADGGQGDGGASDAGMADGGSRPDAGMDGGSRPDGGGADGGLGDGGLGDGGQRGGGADGGEGDGGRGDGGAGERERPGDGGSSGDEPGAAGADGGHGDGGQAEEGGKPEPLRMSDGGLDVSKREAERLLDSIKSSEKNMQLWRFRQKTSKSDPHGKDW